MIGTAEAMLDLCRDGLLGIPCSGKSVNPYFGQSVIGEQRLAYLILKRCCVIIP